MEINKIYNEDCKIGLKKLPNNSIDYIITSPPYFNQRIYSDNKDEIGKEESITEYLDKLIIVMKESVRVIKNNGLIFINIGDIYLKNSLQLIPFTFAQRCINELGLMLIQNITWCKNNPAPKPSINGLTPSTEPIFVFAKTKSYAINKYEPKSTDKNNINIDTGNKGSKYKKLISESLHLTSDQKQNAINDIENSIKDITNGVITDFRMKIKGIHALPFGGQQGGRLNQINNNGYTIIKMYDRTIKKDYILTNVETIKGNKHIAVYPKELVKEILSLITTTKNTIVLDPFMGSGTTAVCCKEIGINYIGYEINNDYIRNIINPRLQQIKNIK